MIDFARQEEQEHARDLSAAGNQTDRKIELLKKTGIRTKRELLKIMTDNNKHHLDEMENIANCIDLLTDRVERLEQWRIDSEPRPIWLLDSRKQIYQFKSFKLATSAKNNAEKKEKEQTQCKDIST